MFMSRSAERVFILRGLLGVLSLHLICNVLCNDNNLSVFLITLLQTVPERSSIKHVDKIVN